MGNWIADRLLMAVAGLNGTRDTIGIVENSRDEDSLRVIVCLTFYSDLWESFFQS